MEKNRELSDMLAELTNFGINLKACGNSLTDCGESLIRTAAVMWNYFSGESGQWPSVMKEQNTTTPAAGRKTETKAEAKAETNKASAAGDAITPKAESEAETKKFSFIEVRKAFSAKSHEGYTEEVRALIAKYGADKLSAVKEADYEAIMADLEKIG